MKPFLYIYIILFALASVTFSPVTAAAQSFAPPSEQVDAGTFHRTPAQKGVKVSTDVLALALPASALVGALVQKDWQGLLQGVETAAATAAATYILKYTVKERRPDGSDLHSFPSGHTAVSFATAAWLQRRYGWAYGAPAYALACYVGWGRCYSKKHFWYDALAGAAIGAGSAYIFTRPFAKKHNLQVSPVTDGSNIGVYASFEF
ncbi:MAG: phosphatase PAP2 family protein [Muribaculaceae bacterium]|nr:phosphatase PAP2 family protein [Muribaculaceae bacterium]